MSPKQTVLVTRKLPTAVEARLQRDYDARLNPDDRLYTRDELIERARGAQAILPCHTEHFSADVIERLPAEVRIIANFSVGYDHVDVEAARRRGIVVTNTPDVLSDATAELTMMLMIGAARRAGEGEKLVRERLWKDWSPAFMVGTQVTGKRLGILGMGRVGRVVARRARGFDMAIHYHDLRPLAGRRGRVPRDAGGHAAAVRLPQPPLQRHAGHARPDERARDSRCCRTAPSWSTRHAVRRSRMTRSWRRCDRASCGRPGSTPTTTSPTSIRGSWRCPIRSSCRISAAPRARRAMRWGSVRSTTSTRFSPGVSPAIG